LAYVLSLHFETDTPTYLLLMASISRRRVLKLLIELMVSTCSVFLW
jgi:hypothetical protein